MLSEANTLAIMITRHSYDLIQREYFSVATTLSCFMFFSNYGKCTFLGELFSPPSGCAKSAEWLIIGALFCQNGHYFVKFDVDGQ